MPTSFAYHTAREIGELSIDYKLRAYFHNAENKIIKEL